MDFDAYNSGLYNRQLPKADAVLFTAFTIDRSLGLGFSSRRLILLRCLREHMILLEIPIGKTHVLLYRVSVHVSFAHVYNRDINFWDRE